MAITPLVRCRLAAMLAVALLVLCVVTPAAGAKRPPPRPIYWGAVIGNQLTGEAPPWDMNALYTFENQAEKGASLLAFSSPFADCISMPCSYYYFPTNAMEAIRRNGTIPILTWASQSVPPPPDLSEPEFQLSD